jgi:hypothetical protein
MGQNNQLYETIPEKEQELDVNQDNLHVNKYIDTPNQEENYELPPTTKRTSRYRQRSAEARHSRNRKRNKTHRYRRYRHFFTRQVYHLFTMSIIKRVLRQQNIQYVHIKIVDTLLVIGVKNDTIKHDSEQKLPGDIFNRHGYYYY